MEEMNLAWGEIDKMEDAFAPDGEDQLMEDVFAPQGIEIKPINVNFEDLVARIRNNNKIKIKKTMLNNVTIGADPEVFIFNTSTKTVVSSIGIIPGEKGDPWIDPTWPKGFGLEIDNILGEFNIPPCKTKEEFIDSIVFMKKYIREHVKKINPNYDIRCRASYLVPEDQLQSKEAKLFG